MEKIRIGTRGSRLALVQAGLVQEAIRQASACVETELVILHTKGDRILDKPLAEIGDKGLFVSEFEQALLEGRIDLAVHSAKDLPMRLAEGLTIAAVLKRADVRDVLVVKKGGRLPQRVEELLKTTAGAQGDTDRKGPEPFVLGTGSKRRQAQAQLCWRDIKCELIRGNVETRLKKLAEGKYDGILLAKAGLDRLGIGAETEPAFDFHVLPAEFFFACRLSGHHCGGSGKRFAAQGFACKNYGQGNLAAVSGGTGSTGPVGSGLQRGGCRMVQDSEGSIAAGCDVWKRKSFPFCKRGRGGWYCAGKIRGGEGKTDAVILRKALPVIEAACDVGNTW